jgi:hypothetical protein
MEEFNKEFDHKLASWPWQRPGFELGMMLKKIIAEVPGCDGVVLGGHGLFTWGNTQRESYLNTIYGFFRPFGVKVELLAGIPGQHSRFEQFEPGCRAALKTENVGNGVGLLHSSRIRAQAPCT